MVWRTEFDGQDAELCRAREPRPRLRPERSGRRYVLRIGQQLMERQCLEGTFEMIRNTRRSGDRAKNDRGTLLRQFDCLESRELLSGGNSFTIENPDLFPSVLFRRVDASSPTLEVGHPIGSGPRTLSFLDSDGKVITGETPDGDEFSITVHGPGVAIVTDITPNDGILNSEIDTIQLVGTDINRTYVTGQVKESDRVISEDTGTIGFERLIAADGVASIVLNGFILTETGKIDEGTPEIDLRGGVRTLAFTAVDAAIDVPSEPPIDIKIGTETTPLRVSPNVKIDHIFNTAFNSILGPVPDVPITTPTVQLIVNGTIRSLELGSAAAAPFPAPVNAAISPVSLTGRTSIQTFGVDRLKVIGSAENFTVSRTAQPFTEPFSSVDAIGHAQFGGTADALAIDASAGTIGRLEFLRGLGNPLGTSESLLEAGIPLGFRGYPASGLAGGVISAEQIGGFHAGPSNLIRQIPPDPNNIQERSTNEVAFRTRPGGALTNVTLASAGSIGETSIVGNLRNSLIASGYDYPSFLQSLDPVRSPSHIAPYTQRGDLIDSVVAASYRPVDGIYGNGNDLAGNGQIQGVLNGAIFLSEDLASPLTLPPRVRGVGFFAEQVRGNLPSVGGPQAELPKRFQSVLFRV